LGLRKVRVRNIYGEANVSEKKGKKEKNFFPSLKQLWGDGTKEKTFFETMKFIHVFSFM